MRTLEIGYAYYAHKQNTLLICTFPDVKYCSVSELTSESIEKIKKILEKMHLERNFGSSKKWPILRSST